MACFCRCFLPILTSKRVDHIFSKSNMLIETQKENCGLESIVMYTVHCENTLRIEAIECIK